MQILKRAILFICPNLDENKSTALLWEEINALAIHKSIRIAIFVYTIPIALSIWAIASYAIFPYLGEELTGLRFVVLVGLIALGFCVMMILIRKRIRAVSEENETD